MSHSPTELPSDPQHSESFSLAHIKSTSGHRKSERSCVMSQFINQSFVPPATSAALMIKFAQVSFSIHGFFKPKAKPCEKGVHALQAGLAFSQFVVNSILYFDHVDCSETTHKLCSVLTFLELLYNATLTTGWMSAEFLKEPHQESSEELSSLGNSAKNSSEDSSSEGDEEIGEAEKQRRYEML
ncbi:MAG: hypothetical protein Q8R83_06865 [Legionellaceae bacterium]|nr:hypothetical protein [Legionellaceae bacterium]